MNVLNIKNRTSKGLYNCMHIHTAFCTMHSVCISFVHPLFCSRNVYIKLASLFTLLTPFACVYVYVCTFMHV